MIKELVIPIILFAFGVFSYFSNNLTLMSLILSITYFYALIGSYVLYKRINVILLFLMAFGAFNLSRIVISLIYPYDWSFGNMFKEFSFSLTQSMELLLCLFVFISSVNISIWSTSLFHDKQLHSYPSSTSSWVRLEMFTVILMSISIIQTILRKIIEMNAMSGMSYSDIYVPGSVVFNVPIYLRGWNVLFELSFYLFLASRPRKSLFILFSFLFVFVNFLSAINGTRTGLIISIFLVIGMYSYFYRMRLSLRLIVFSLALVVFSQVISSIRSFQPVDSSLITNIINFFIEQGASMNVILFNEDYREYYMTGYELNIFSSFYDGFMALLSPSVWVGQSEELIQHTLSLGAQLSYAINPNYYLLGFGIGGNSLAEVVNFSGLLGIAIYGMIIVKLTHSFETSSGNSYIILLSIPFIKNLYISPRASVFPTFQELLFFILLALLLFTVDIISGNLKLTRRAND